MHPRAFGTRRKFGDGLAPYQSAYDNGNGEEEEEDEEEGEEEEEDIEDILSTLSILPPPERFPLLARGRNCLKRWCLPCWREKEESEEEFVFKDAENISLNPDRQSSLIKVGYQSLEEGDKPMNLPKKQPQSRHKRGRKSATLSVEFLRQQDRRPVHLAWGLFCLYCVLGVWYFSCLKKLNLRESFYQTVISLSAVGYGNFQPENNIEKVWTCIFLFIGVGFIGTFIGMIASSGLDFQDDLKEEWLRQQSSASPVAPGRSLVDMQTRFARVRLARNIFRVALAIAIGTVALMWMEGWSWGEAFYFSTQEVMGSGWVEEMPQTKSGKWFTLVYALVGSLLIYHAMGDLAAIPLAIRESRFQAQVLSQWGQQLTPRKLRSLLKRAHEVENHTTIKPLAVPDNTPVNGKEKKVSKRTVNRDEFVLSMLLLMGKVSMSDIRECQKVFETLDKDGTGFLDEADVARHWDDRMGLKWTRMKKLGSKDSKEVIPTPSSSPPA